MVTVHAGGALSSKDTFADRVNIVLSCVHRGGLISPPRMYTVVVPRLSAIKVARFGRGNRDEWSPAAFSRLSVRANASRSPSLFL